MLLHVFSGQSGGKEIRDFSVHGIFRSKAKKHFRVYFMDCWVFVCLFFYFYFLGWVEGMEFFCFSRFLFPDFLGALCIHSVHSCAPFVLIYMLSIYGGLLM